MKELMRGGWKRSVIDGVAAQETVRGRGSGGTVEGVSIHVSRGLRERIE